MKPRALFIAGSTGSIGRTLLPLADQKRVAIIPHLRPKHGATVDPRAAQFDLSNHDALVGALRKCTTVVQLIGTVRARFTSGDTYDSSDIGTTRQLVIAGKEAGIDHFVLLSAVGAGNVNSLVAYLKAKTAAENLVRDSNIPFTLFRPSAFVGGGHRPLPGAAAISSALGIWRYRPIPVETLATAILHCATTREPVDAVLEGKPLWDLAAAAGA